MSYQKIIVAGNLGKDPEVKYGKDGGTAVCSFSLAISEREKSEGEWKEVTIWFDIVCFGKTAENAGQYLSKGKKALVEGRVKLEQFERRDGSPGSAMKILADRVAFLSSKSDDEGGSRNISSKRPSGNGFTTAGRGEPPHERHEQRRDEAAGGAGGGGFIDDDLPFERERFGEW